MVLLTRLHTAGNLQVEVCDPRFSDDKFGLVVNDLAKIVPMMPVRLCPMKERWKVNGWSIERRSRA